MLDLNTISLILLTFLLSISFFIFLSSLTSHPHPNTPCPQSYPIIGNLPGFLRNRHRFHDWVADMLSQTPSSTLQINSFLNLSRGICTANPSNVEHLLVSNFPNYVKGSHFYDVLHELLGHGIFNVDGHLWTVQRKIASHEFNTKSLKHFISDTVNSEISTRLIPYLSRICDENKVIDLQSVLQKFGFDNICNVAFGTDPACLDSENTHQNQNTGLRFVKAFDDAVDICSSRFMSPLSLVWKIKRFFKIGSEKRFKQAIEEINNYAMEIIKLKEASRARADEDLLSRFMHVSANSMEFQDEDQKRRFLRDIVISFILAGRDSTSIALTWFFWLISGHPHCAHKVYDELPERISSYDDLKKLHYLHAALSESMRLFPPVPINSRFTVDDDVLPDGSHVGKGWFADYSAYAMGRMEKVWGEDCREFKPERWLDCDGHFQPSDQFRFAVFHGGPRTCLGKEMAYVQMKSVVAAVMHEFEVVAVDGGASAENMMNPPYTLSLVLKMRGGLPARLYRRGRRQPHQNPTFG